MKSMRTDVGNFRLKRKCPTFSGRWLLMLGSLLLLVAYVSCRPSNEEYDGFDDEYPDVDNVEIHRVKIVDGVMHAEDHPVIFYKEDFVSEDYDPDKHKNAAGALRPRKYKDISRRHRYNRTDGEHYRALKPEKIYFDVLPQTPVVTADDSSANDSNFDVSNIRVEVLSLADDTAEVEQEDEDEISKQILSKRPKKYRRRMRRDTLENEHRLQKRNPRYAQGYENIYQNFFSSLSPQSNYVRHPVKGIYYNPLSVAGPPLKPVGFEIAGRFGPENEPDRVPWGSRQYDNKQTIATTQRPMPPLFHDSRPENADVSFLTTRRPPQTSPTNSVPPLFHNSNPNNWDTSFIATRRPIGEVQPAPPPTAPPQDSTQVSKCVWAIVSCCTPQNMKIRNSCFEAMDCGRNFWGLNPCSDNIREQALQRVDSYLQS